MTLRNGRHSRFHSVQALIFFLQDFESRSSFDGSGYVIDPTTSSIYDEGGSVYVAVSDVPEPLSSDATIDDFPEDSWDCSDVERTIVIDPSSDAHKSCECEIDSFEFDGEFCGSSLYKYGEDI